jgi:hypothetical protein
MSFFRISKKTNDEAKSCSNGGGEQLTTGLILIQQTGMIRNG